jgi:hypothetical protein
VTEQQNPDSPSKSPARNIVGLVVGSSSLIVAILIYMGWAYDSAYYGHFHLDPLQLGFDPLDYTLRSLSLFSPYIVLAAIGFILLASFRAWREVATAVRAIVRGPVRDAFRWVVTAGWIGWAGWPGWPLDRDHGGASPAAPTDPSAEETHAEQPASRSRRAAPLLASAGLVLTLGAVALYWGAFHVAINTYLVLGALGGTPLLLTWPARADRLGRAPYALAIVITAICALWAGSVYAEQLGNRDAASLVRNLPTHSGVAVYSTQQLAVQGPGVSRQPVPPSAGLPYHYVYTGLRLLLMQGGTYYLLPEKWSSRLDFTYIISESDQVSIELY